MKTKMEIVRGMQFDNKIGRLAMLKEMWDECYTANQQMQEVAKESHEFYVGNQFNDGELTAITNKKMTPMVYNIIQKNVNYMVGVCEMNKNRAKVVPYEFNDSDNANILDMILDQSMQKCNAYVKTVMAYKDANLGGLGYLIAYMDYDRDLINGELRIEFEPYSNVWVDPTVKEKDFSDARYLIIRKAVDENIMILRHPEFEDAIKASSKDYKSDPNVMEETGLKGLVSVKEYWFKEIEKVYHVYDGQNITKFNKKEYEENKEEILARIDGDEEKIIEVNSYVYKYSVVINDSILVYDGYSPYGDNYFPIVPFIGFCDMSADQLKKKFFGLIEVLKDVQRDKNRNKVNRRYAQNASLHSGWFVTKGSVDSTNQLKIGMGMQIVETNPNVADPRRIPLPQYPQYLFNEEDKNDQDRLTIGLNADALGVGASSVDSSKAISLRQQTSMTTVAEIPAHYSVALRRLAKICLDMIMQSITADKIKRIVGTNYEFDETVFNSLIEREYDVVIDESSLNPSHKMQVINQLSEYMQYSGQPVPLDLYLQFTEIDPALRKAFMMNMQKQQATAQPPAPPQTMQ